jgi:hypothetical protein
MVGVIEGFRSALYLNFRHGLHGRKQSSTVHRPPSKIHRPPSTVRRPYRKKSVPIRAIRGNAQKRQSLPWKDHRPQPPIVRRPSSIVRRPSSAVHRPPTTLPPSPDDRPQTTDDSQPSSIVHRPSSIVHRPSSIVHRPHPQFPSPPNPGIIVLDVKKPVI